MPEMDGYEATTIIRDPDSDVPDHDIPVIAMTANAMKGDLEKCIAAGMNGYVPKPIDPDELYKALKENLLDKKGPKTLGGTSVEKVKTLPPDASDISELPVFDRSELMSRINNNTEMFDRLLTMFKEMVPVEIDKLKQMAETKEATEIKAQAHKMKGFFANISAKALREVACEMEKAAENNNLDKSRNLITVIENEYEKFCMEVSDNEI